ncbi:MAG: tetratricopeptide repeat protein [Gammaproteobacteria bacterium]|nr:tetratricopeptide repeat protein [Gammaproteobacteria bacterium]
MNISRQAFFIHFMLACMWLAGCAGNQTVAPIEGRNVQQERPAAARPAVAPKPAPVPAPAAGSPVVRALPDTESPAVRAIPIPEAGATVLPVVPPDTTASPGPATARAPAIAELLARADESAAQGRHDAARASLERAVKIAPRDAELWQRLAMASYAQGDWAQAKSLAERSNSFAAPDSALASRNWTLIGNAELKLGNQSGAAAAFERSASP